MEIILRQSEIPDDLKDFFEPIDSGARTDVFNVSTKPFKEAHFAVFPPDLIEPCILAGSPEKACPHCGAPWERVTKRGGPIKTVGRQIKIHKAQGTHGKTSVFNTGYIVERITTGWKPTCQCEGNDGSGRGIVLDPFFGSGTTGLVAQKHGRQWIGVELNPEYIRIAEERLGNIKIVLNEETEALAKSG